MDDKIKYLAIFSLTGIVLAGGAYYFFRRPLKLSAWHEEYISEISDMLKSNKNNEPTMEIIAHIYFLFEEIEEYLYQHNFPMMTRDRIDSSEDMKEYVKIFIEYMEGKAEFYEKAKKIVEKRLNITMEKLEEIRKENKSELDIFKKTRKPYHTEILPKVENSILKTAYLYYAKEKLKLKEQENELRSPNIPREQMMKMYHRIILLKTNLSDITQSKFGIPAKYLEQLLVHNDLMRDAEVRYYYEILNGNDISY